MLWNQFILQNTHFAVNLLAALAFFSVFWLYFDAWVNYRRWKELPRLAGYLSLALSYILSAGTVESVIVPNPLIPYELGQAFIVGFRLLGYGLVGLGIWLEPLQKTPQLEGIKKTDFAPAILLLSGWEWWIQSRFLLPILAGLTGLLYLRRGTLGLEAHVRPLARVLFGMSVVEGLALAAEFRTTSNVDVHAWVAPFGYLWHIELGLLLICSIGLLHWVWQYLLKRLETQLFMLYTTTVLITFLAITVVFTGLLVKNVQDVVLDGLDTDVRVLEYALDSRRAVARADAETLAGSAHIQATLTEQDTAKIMDEVEQYLLAKSESMMIVTDGHGKVMARGEDRNKYGDSLSDNALVAKALRGEWVDSVVISEGALHPQVWVQAAAPIKSGTTVIGAVLTGLLLDDAFVDGIYQATNLQTSIYADDVIAATTFRSVDATGRYTGMKESNPAIYDKVLRGETITRSVRLFNSDYFGAYQPLKNSDGAVVGMLFVGTPQATIYQTAGRSIEMTFLAAVGLLILSIIPSKLVTQFIVRQLR